jgi:nicotinamidase-related amidase
VFTRFMPPDRPEDAAGAWRRYYAHWRHMTGERLDPRLIQLVPPLAALVPLAIVIDKTHCSPFKEQAVLRRLARVGADALIISGGETDVCVLAAVMDAVDAGYRVILTGGCFVQRLGRIARRHAAAIRLAFQPADRGRPGR